MLAKVSQKHGRYISQKYGSVDHYHLLPTVKVLLLLFNLPSALSVPRFLDTVDYSACSSSEGPPYRNVVSLLSIIDPARLTHDLPVPSLAHY